MRNATRLACLVVLLLAASSRAATVEYRAIVDDDRDRDIPIKLYTPAEAGEEPRPLVLFSHGLGGNVEAAVYLCEGLAEVGYVVVAVQHPGSDESIRRGLPRDEQMAALRKAMGARQAIARPRDVTAVIDALLEDETLNIDAERIGVAGHSYGAHTALSLAGRPLGFGQRERDPRIKAAVALSGQPNRNPKDAQSIEVPMLHVTGTLDKTFIRPDVTPAERRKPFDRATAEHQYLIIFDQANHSVFARDLDGPMSRLPGEAKNDPKRDAEIQASVVLATRAFFDAFLQDEPQPLTAEQMREHLAEVDMLETK